MFRRLSCLLPLVLCSALWGGRALAAEPARFEEQRETLTSAVLDAALATPTAASSAVLAERLSQASTQLSELQAFAGLLTLLRHPPVDSDDEDTRRNWQRLTVRALIANGLITRASRELSQLPAREPAQQALWVELAAALLQRGEPQAALAALSSEPPTVGSLRAPWLDLTGRALLALGRSAEAAQRYADFYQADAFKLLSWSRSDALQLHTLRYNAAVSLLQTGAVDAGLSQLDQLGQLELQRLNTSELRALRDLANVTLGEQLLRAGKAAAAREAYRRVRLQGPYSSAALLGLGWASLAPAGKPQARRDTPVPAISADTPDFVLRTLARRGVIDCALYTQRFPRGTAPCPQGTQLPQQNLPADETARLGNVLGAWQQLIEQDPHSLHGREARLALAQVQVQGGLGAAGETAESLEQLARELGEEQAGLREAGLGYAAREEQTLISGADLAAPNGLEAARLPAPRWLLLLRDEPLQQLLRDATALEALQPHAQEAGQQEALQALIRERREAARVRLSGLFEAEASQLQRLQQAALKTALALRDPAERASLPPSPTTP